MAECQHQGSTYIQVRLLVTEDRSTNGVSRLTGKLQARRTNAWSGETYQYGGSTSAKITINGTSKTFTSLRVNGGQQNVWQDQGSLTVDVSHTSAVTVNFSESVSGTSYFNGSASGSINCAAFSTSSGGSSTTTPTTPTYTSPSISSISGSATSTSAISVSGRVSSFGSGSGANSVKLGIASGSATSVSGGRREVSVSASTSTQYETINNSTSPVSGGITIQANTKYKAYIYASNGMRDNYSLSSGIWTPPPPVTQINANTSRDSVSISCGYSAATASVAQDIYYRTKIGDGSYTAWAKGGTIPAGSNAGSFNIDGIDAREELTIEVRLYYSGSGLYGSSKTISLSSVGGFYGNVGGKAKFISKSYCRDEHGKARVLLKMYGRDEQGKARRIF